MRPSSLISNPDSASNALQAGSSTTIDTFVIITLYVLQEASSSKRQWCVRKYREVTIIVSAHLNLLFGTHSCSDVSNVMLPLLSMILIEGNAQHARIIIHTIQQRMSAFIKIANLVKPIMNKQSNAKQDSKHQQPRFLILNALQIDHIGTNNHFPVLDVHLIYLITILQLKGVRFVQGTRNMIQLEDNALCNVLLGSNWIQLQWGAKI